MIWNHFDSFFRIPAHLWVQNVLAKHELQFLCTFQVEDGYVFPLNPVWPVRDKGWWVTGPHSAGIEPSPRIEQMHFQED